MLPPFAAEVSRRNWTNPHASCVAIVRTTAPVRPEGEPPKSLKCFNFDAKYSNSLKVNVNPIDLLHIRIHTVDGRHAKEPPFGCIKLCNFLGFLPYELVISWIFRSKGFLQLTAGTHARLP